MLDPRAGIRKAGAMPPLMALLKEVVEVREFWMEFRSIWASHLALRRLTIQPQ